MSRTFLVHLNIEVPDDFSTESIGGGATSDAETVGAWIKDGIDIHAEANDDLGPMDIDVALAEEI